MRYIRLKSLTWWAGFFLISMGMLQASGLTPEQSGLPQGLVGILEALTDAVAALSGGTGQQMAPAALIGLGMGLIGLRDAQHRAESRAEDRDLTIMMMAGQQAMDDVSVKLSDAPYDWSTPEGESPLPDGVIDPWAPGGSRE